MCYVIVARFGVVIFKAMNMISLQFLKEFKQYLISLTM